MNGLLAQAAKYKNFLLLNSSNVISPAVSFEGWHKPILFTSARLHLRCKCCENSLPTIIYIVHWESRRGEHHIAMWRKLMGLCSGRKWVQGGLTPATRTYLLVRWFFRIFNISWRLSIQLGGFKVEDTHIFIWSPPWRAPVTMWVIVCANLNASLNNTTVNWAIEALIILRQRLQEQDRSVEPRIKLICFLLWWIDQTFVWHLFDFPPITQCEIKHIPVTCTAHSSFRIKHD